MGTKKFFSSTWFRCISVLLIIAVVAGGLLAALNDVLYVTPSERSGRAIKKIYGKKLPYEVVLDIDETDDSKNDAIVYDELGSINKVYNVSVNGKTDMLIQATGFGGYKGTVTVWVRVTTDGSKYDIATVILESYTKETLMSKLTDEFYNKFCLKDVTALYNAGENFTPYPNEGGIQNVVSGATKSSNAGCNAVNSVIKYLGEL